MSLRSAFINTTISQDVNFRLLEIMIFFSFKFIGCEICMINFANIKVLRSINLLFYERIREITMSLWSMHDLYCLLVKNIYYFDSHSLISRFTFIYLKAKAKSV